MHYDVAAIIKRFAYVYNIQVKKCKIFVGYITNLLRKLYINFSFKDI